MELEGNVLTRRYGWDGGKLSYDTTDAYGAPVNPTLVEVIDE